MRPGTAGTTSVLILLTVPEDWPDLDVKEVARKMRANEPNITNFLASEVVRWGNRDEIDHEGLKQFVDSLARPPEREDGET